MSPDPSSQVSRPLVRRLRTLAAGMLLVLLLLLVCLPLLLSWGVEYALRQALTERGMHAIQVERLWMNPYRGVVHIERLRFSSGRQDYRLDNLALDLALLDLRQRLLRLKSVRLSGLDVRIEQSAATGLRINDMSLAAAQEDAKASDEPPPSDAELWQLALDQVTLEDVQLALDLEGLQASVQLQQLTLSNLDTGAEEGAELSMSLLLESLSLPAGQLDLDLQLSLSSDLNLQRPALSEWQLQGEHQLLLEQLHLSLPQGDLKLPRTELTLTTAGAVGDELNYDLGLQLDTQNVTLNTDERPQLQLEQLQLQAQLDGAGLLLSQLSASGLSLPAPAEGMPALLNGGRLNMNGARLQWPDAGRERPLTVTVESLDIPQAELSLLRTASGELPQVAALQALSAADSDEPGDTVADTPTDEAAPIRLSLAQLTLGPDVTLQLRDEGINPPLREQIRIRQLQLQQLSLTDRDTQSTLQAQLELSHGSGLEVEGEFNLPTQSADLALALEGFELLAVSGYSQQLTGYALESGRLTLESDLQLQQGLLDSDNRILIDSVRLRSTHEGRAQQFAQSLTMPLDQALDLLRDGDDQIRLQVPVSGRLDDPQVDLQQVINKALGGAMKKASVLVLKNLLQPYSTIYTVAEAAGSQLTRLRLEPVQFAPGSAEMDAQARDYAGKVAELLRQRESLTLRLCGVTNAADLGQLAGSESAEAATEYAEPLQNLAAERASQLRQHLQQQLQINPQQLLACLPRHRQQSEATAGVELSL